MIHGSFNTVRDGSKVVQIGLLVYTNSGTIARVEAAVKAPMKTVQYGSMWFKGGSKRVSELQGFRVAALQRSIKF
jgi:hypothetical protein